MSVEYRYASESVGRVCGSSNVVVLLITGKFRLNDQIFSSNVVSEEHVLPLSRSLNNAFIFKLS